MFQGFYLSHTHEIQSVNNGSEMLSVCMHNIKKTNNKRTQKSFRYQLEVVRLVDTDAWTCADIVIKTESGQLCGDLITSHELRCTLRSLYGLVRHCHNTQLFLIHNPAFGSHVSCIYICKGRPSNTVSDTISAC